MNTSRRVRPLALAAVLAAGAVLLAGCATATPAPAGASSAPSSPDADAAGALEVAAGWLDGGRMIALVTWGSSGCVPTASGVALQVDGTLSVTLDDGPADRTCTADYAARVTPVALPDGVDPAQNLALVVTGGQGERGETELAGVAGLSSSGATDYAPSAGWVGDSLIAVLTWGSSSCPPQVAAVSAPTPAEVAVSFTDPPADQVCTMDMGPRAFVVSVDGLDVTDKTSVTLSGGGAAFATPVTVPVLGSPS